MSAQGKVVPDNTPVTARSPNVSVVANCAELWKPPANNAVSIMKGNSHPLISGAAAQVKGAQLIRSPLAKVQQADEIIMEEDKSKEIHGEVATKVLQRTLWRNHLR